MTDDVDSLFGGRTPPRPTFTDRLRGPSPAQPPVPVPATILSPLPEEADDDGSYKPYGYFPSGTIGEVCDVRRFIDGTDRPEGIEFQYRFLMQVGYVGQEQLRLFLPDCIVLIEGKSLTDLRKRLARRTVTFIQQYHQKVWPTQDVKEPFIERIEIIKPETFKANG